jgi:hypothetical protein
MRYVGEAVKDCPRMGVKSGLLVAAIDGLVDLVPVGILNLRDVVAVVARIPSLDKPGVVIWRGFNVIVEVHQESKANEAVMCLVGMSQSALAATRASQ